jgi:hypothetical protein
MRTDVVGSGLDRAAKGSLETDLCHSAGGFAPRITAFSDGYVAHLFSATRGRSQYVLVCEADQEKRPVRECPMSNPVDFREPSAEALALARWETDGGAPDQRGERKQVAGAT